MAVGKLLIYDPSKGMDLLARVMAIKTYLYTQES